MQKIISLFQRNYDGDRQVRDEVVPGAEWVQEGEGIATVKWDGTCCMIQDGWFFRRHTVRKGKTAPPHWEAAAGVDPVTGKQAGWVPVNNSPSDCYHREGLTNSRNVTVGALGNGTYELVGPKVQGNPEGLDRHRLMRHGMARLPGFPRDFAGIRLAFQEEDIDGVVWHHPDGRMVKIKCRDFGLKRGGTYEKA